MSYLKLTERHPRGEIDLPRFAADLVAAFNALDTNPALEAKLCAEQGDYPNERQLIDLVGGDRLRLSANNYDRRVSIAIDATDVAWNDRNTYAKDHRTESASVNPAARGIAAIARDILRRVIEPSRPALKLQRDYAAQQHANRNGIVEHANTLRAAAPTLSVRVEKDALQAALYLNVNGLYLSGELSCDGRVKLRDLSSFPADKLPALLQLLGADKERE